MSSMKNKSPLLLKPFNEDSKDVAFKLLERGLNVLACETPDGKVGLAILTRETPEGAGDVSPGEGHLYLQFEGEEKQLEFPLSTAAAEFREAPQAALRVRSHVWGRPEDSTGQVRHSSS